MNNKKAFTLIELLAVIIILGLLMAIAIPSISKYIEQSRKKTYINTAQSYVDGLSRELAVRDISLDESVAYYIPFNCIPLERGGKSPNGDWDFGYVGLSINNGKRKYYIYSKDVKGMGIPSLEINNIKYTDVETITTGKDDLIALDGKISIAVVPDTCDLNNLIVKEGPIQPGDSCFNITSDGMVTSNFPGSYIEEYGMDILIPDKDSSCYSENLIIPSTINGIKVKSIGPIAFPAHDLKTVIIPNGVTSIEYGAFAFNQLTSISIPNGVTSIGDQVFALNQLGSATIPNSVTLIGECAFCTNQLTSIIIPNSVTSIKQYAFYENQLSSVTISNGVISIAGGVFMVNNLTSITIPNGVTTIVEGAFHANPLESVTFLGRENLDGIYVDENAWDGSPTLNFLP